MRLWEQGRHSPSPVGHAVRRRSSGQDIFGGRPHRLPDRPCFKADSSKRDWLMVRRYLHYSLILSTFTSRTPQLQASKLSASVWLDPTAIAIEGRGKLDAGVGMAAAWHGGIATTRARALPSTAPRTPVRAAAAVAEGTRGERAAMSSSAAKVAVVGCGISGALCASILAGRGISVTVFESGRGPGGRMSQRRELAEDEELVFDHGAPCFSTSNEEVTNIVKSWEEMGLISEWKEKFGCFDMKSSNFVDFEKDGSSKKYVGVPGMNSICKELCREPGVETKFESAVGKLNWLEGRNMWHLSGMSSENLGHFDSVVVSDKNVFSPRYAGLTGRPPPLEMSLIPELAGRLPDIPVQSCFALMLAFSEPLSLIPVKGFSFKNSNVLNWAFCDSSKPGRLLSSSISERWVLHSTAEYAANVINKTGLKKPTRSTLVEVAGELLQEFERTGLVTSRPFFMKAHRWGSAFPATSVGGEAMCLWDNDKRLAICGDFCVSPSVEGAILSSIRAASKVAGVLSSL